MRRSSRRPPVRRAKQRPVKKPPPAPPPPAVDEHGLNRSQLEFCEQYLANSYIASKAYALAYPGAAASTCEVNGCRLLRDAKVRAYLDKRVAEKHGPIQATADEALGWLALVLRADPAQAYKNGKLLPVDEWPTELRQVLVQVKDGGFTLERKLTAVVKLLELHGKLKNPLAEAGDALAEALRRDLDKHGRHQ